MDQITLFGEDDEEPDKPPKKIERELTPRQLGVIGAQTALARAIRVNGFSPDSARAFVLNYLSIHGDSWSEDVVDAAAASGIEGLSTDNAKSWGGIFGGLGREGGPIICVCKDGERRKGHGTSGARKWALRK